MRIIICGSRSFDKLVYLTLKMDRLTAKLDRTKLTILSGHAKGADQTGEEWAFRSLIKTEIYHANWDKLGKKAGMVRNAEMVKAAGKKAVLVAFWDGKSPGTEAIIGMAKKAGLKVRVFTDWKEKR